MDKKIIMLLFLSGVMTFAMACSKSDGTKDNRTQSTSVKDSNDEGVQESSETTEKTTMYDNADDNTDISEGYLSGIIPDELEYIPQGYENPAEQQGRLEKLTYDTWESFTYEQKTQKLTKEAWVYIPYGYSDDEKYNVFYLSHGGWSNETSLMGTDEAPRVFKNIIDNAIQDGKIKPLIIVLPTYNNTSEEDSGDYSLAIRLTNNFHNELVNDLIPAVESRYSTYAEDTTPEGLKKSRDHRGFG